MEAQVVFFTDDEGEVSFRNRAKAVVGVLNSRAAVDFDHRFREWKAVLPETIV